jgi:two-component system KDP operon response regulator KdpE
MVAEGVRILVVDDEPAICRMLSVALGGHGYQVRDARTGEAGLVEAATWRPDLLILDLGLPDMEGHEVIRRLREWADLPVIILSVRDQDSEKITALDAGADDYLTKPFSMGELLARLRSALRRAARPGGAGEDVVRLGDLEIDLVRRRVSVAGRAVHLTPTEYGLLRVLAQNTDRVVTHRFLLQSVWGKGYEDEDHYVRVYVGQLRRKIEPDPARPRYLLTEPGVGYRLTGRPGGTDGEGP